MKRWVSGLAVMGLGVSVLATGCSSDAQPTVAKTVAAGQKVVVYSELQAQADFVKEIGKDKVEVHTYLPDGINVWQWAPTLAEQNALETANLFVINGGGMEKRWYDQMSQQAKLKNPSLLTVDASQGLEQLKLLAYLNADDPEEQKKEHVDPYFYLDPVNAQKEVDTIEAALEKVAPTYKDEFKKNADAYKQKLSDLDKQFATMAQKAKHKEIVSPYPAYQYLAKRYNLKYFVTKKFSWNDMDVDQKDEMDEIKEELKQHDIKAVYFQQEASPKVESGLGEMGYFSGVLGAYEGEDKASKQYVSYLDTMQHNLQQLDAGLNK